MGITPGIVPGEASSMPVLAGWMHCRLHVENHFLISAHHGDRDGVTSSDVEGGVKYILGIAYLFLPHL